MSNVKRSLHLRLWNSLLLTDKDSFKEQMTDCQACWAALARSLLDHKQWFHFICAHTWLPKHTRYPNYHSSWAPCTHYHTETTVRLHSVELRVSNSISWTRENSTVCVITSKLHRSPFMTYIKSYPWIQLSDCLCLHVYILYWSLVFLSYLTGPFSTLHQVHNKMTGGKL